jgi:hypothetical protein
MLLRIAKLDILDSDYKYGRYDHIANNMHEIAATSLITHKHAAVVISNGQPAAYGVNNIRGARPYHAEAEAVRSYLINRGLLGWVKTCRILWGYQPPKGEGATKC